MFLMLQIATVFLAAVAMSLALAHALELPGKMRLDKETYIAVQAIYYPGFTYGGFGEGLGILATLVLLIMTPTGQPAFWWTLTALVTLLAMQVVYWMITHPVNKFWLKDTRLKGFGAGFFSLGSKQGAASENESDAWIRLRNQWEYSHVLRAVFSVIAVIALIIAIAM
jgi:Domain of unknown function (DUF1772)